MGVAVTCLPSMCRFTGSRTVNVDVIVVVVRLGRRSDLAVPGIWAAQPTQWPASPSWS